eukprot:3111294-Pyramimonas_sp.AAC.1
MAFRKKAGRDLLGRIPKRDRGIRDNVDGTGPTLACPMIHKHKGWNKSLTDVPVAIMAATSSQTNGIHERPFCLAISVMAWHF